MRTPAGQEREQLTGLLLDADPEMVKEELTGRLGAKRTREIRREMESNGASPQIRDYCAELDNATLRKACKRLKLL